MRRWLFGSLAETAVEYIILGLLGIFLISIGIGMLVEWIIGREEK